jgi:membrane protease YdiL (CAAX protease family)
VTETTNAKASSQAVRAATAVIEIAVVFALTFVLVRALQNLPEIQQLKAAWSEELFSVAFRWLPLIAVATAAEAVLRGRTPLAWGLTIAGGLPFQARSAAWLLVLGGTTPLAITLMAPPTAVEQQLTELALATSLLGPVLAQEVFLAGYANTRLQETWPPYVPPLVIAALFGAAHLNHLGNGDFGPLFVAAMALQGWLWSSARAAGVSLWSLAAAHACLLIAYTAPAIALGAIAVLLLLIGRGFPAWWSAVAKP